MCPITPQGCVAVIVHENFRDSISPTSKISTFLGEQPFYTSVRASIAMAVRAAQCRVFGLLKVYSSVTTSEVG